MCRIIWLTALLCAAIPLAAKAQPPSTPSSYSSSVDRLIEQLGDADYRKRDDAVVKLRAEGVKVLPALRQALNHSDPEVRRRVHSLIPALEIAFVLNPSRVSLKIKGRPLREILDAIEKQTDYKIESWGNNNTATYSFDFTNLPFWEALDRISQATGMVLNQGYGDDRIRLQAQEGYVPYVRYDGPFRLVPTGFQHNRNIEFGLVGHGAAGIRRTESLTLGFTVFSEPKLPLLGMGEVEVEAAYDTEKNSMLVPEGSSDEQLLDARFGGMRRVRWISYYGHGNRMMSLQTQVMLARPSEKATGVKMIRGRIPVTLLAEQKPMVVADNILGAKGVQNKIDTTSFRIEDVTPMANKQIQIKMTVTETMDNPQDYTWMTSLSQRLEVQDDKGNKFVMIGNGWGNSAPGNVQMTMTFSPRDSAKFGPPSKLIYYRWKTLQHEIAFEFKDLPLP